MENELKQTDLPKKYETLNCAFQRRDMGAKKIECVLTESGSSNVLFRVVERDACLIDICPMYQNMKMLKRLSEREFSS
jgi:hypothetical protein